jgi:hypothetical protein
MSIAQRVIDLREQETADSEVALRPVRAKYEPLWKKIREDCAASETGHQWNWAANTVEGQSIWRFYQCMARETRA